MAESCAISGSMCFPTGVALRRDRFCLYFLQRLLALTAVKNMLYLYRWFCTFIIEIFRPLIFIILNYYKINPNKSIHILQSNMIIKYFFHFAVLNLTQKLTFPYKIRTSKFSNRLFHPFFLNRCNFRYFRSKLVLYLWITSFALIFLSVSL